jgi:hypothetical protein
MSLQPIGEPEINGDTAVLACEQSVKVTARGQVGGFAPRSVRVTLSKRDGNWIIAEVDETNTLTRDETRLDPQMGTIELEVNPSTIKLTFVKDGESAIREITFERIRVEPGSYTITGTAPGYNTGRTRVTVAAGDRQKVKITLVPEERPTPPPVSIWSDGVLWEDKSDGFQVPVTKLVVLFLRQPDPRTVNFRVRWTLRRKFVWFTHYESDTDHVRWELDIATSRCRRWWHASGACWSILSMKSKTSMMLRSAF